MKQKIGHWLPLAVILQFGVLASSAQTSKYLFSGSKTTVTLSPGIYHITAYGAQGGSGSARLLGVNSGGLGAEMEGKFSFTAPTTLILLVGGSGSFCVGGYGGGGGGGGSFVVNGSKPLVIAGGGGGGSGPAGFGLTATTGGTGGDFNGGIFNGVGGTDGNGGSSGTYAGYGLGVSGGGGGGYFSGGGNGGSSFLGGGAGGAGLNHSNTSGGGTGGGGGFGGGGGGGFYGGGGGGGYSGGGGGGNNGGGGGGSIIDSSAIMILAEVSGIASPDGSPNGEIIITAVHVPAPTIVCPEPLALECTNGSAVGTLEADVIDTNGLPLQVIWTVDGIAYQTNDIPSGGSITESNVTFTANFGDGEHTVVISASNGQTAQVSCSTTVTVSDTLPPTVLAVSATPDLLWPPNHKMISVNMTVSAVDNCDSSLSAKITQVTCNEPQGRFAPDWTIKGPLSVDLRAERLGNSDRVYTIYVDVTDSSGNKTTTTKTVTVPESLGLH